MAKDKSAPKIDKKEKKDKKAAAVKVSPWWR